MTYLHASCRCGQLTLALAQPPQFQLVCHCNDCRAASGEPYLLGAFFPATAASIVGETRQHTDIGGSGKPKHSHHCAACGEFVYVEVEALPGIIAVNAALLIAPFVFEPQAHVWVSQKLPDVSIAADAVCFQRRPALSIVMPNTAKP